MMVIRDRSAPAGKVRADCEGCGSTLEAEKSDLTFAHDSRDGDAYTFACPICKKVNWIDATLVPKEMR